MELHQLEYFVAVAEEAGDTVDAAGGRVLTMCALAGDVAHARARAYAAATSYTAGLAPDQGLRYRSDIGERAAAQVR